MRKTQGRRSKFLAGKTDTFVAIQPSNDFQNTLNVYHSEYRIVASRSMSWLVTCLGLFRLLMKGIFGPYVL